jgi:uncharacterized protein (DUF2384 family)
LGTVSRWEREIASLAPDAEARAVRLCRLSQRIGSAIAGRSLMGFLTTPKPTLRGYAPIDMLGSPYSFEDLLAFVDGALSGDMA